MLRYNNYLCCYMDTVKFSHYDVPLVRLMLAISCFALHFNCFCFCAIFLSIMYIILLLNLKYMIF